MANFPSAVSAPGPASYSAPLLPFTQFQNWAADDPYAAVFKRQQSEQNEQQTGLMRQRLAQGQMAVDASRAIAAGDFRTRDGGIDYAKLVQTMLKFGDVNGLQQLAPLMLQQQAGALAGDPLLQPAGPAAAQPAGQPAARPSAVAPANSPKGDSGVGTVTSLVTDRLPAQNQTTGQTIIKIAEVMGVDPNSDLTPGQIRRAQGLLNQYAPEIAGVSTGGAGASRLPPSANAVSPSPPAAAAPQQGQPAPNGAPSAAPTQGTPLTPQEPLPPGFNDPMQAVGALQRRAAAIEAANPKAKPVADALRAKADRILDGIKPVEVNANTTRLNPTDRSILYQGPAAAAIEASAHATSSPTLDGDAERYLQSGTMPPNLAKNLMGQAEAKAIRDRAAAMAQERGINMADLPQKWQQFKAQQVGIQRFTSGKQGDTVRSFNVLVDHLDTLGEAVTALKNGDTRLLNSVMQAWAANTGGTAPTTFDGVKALVGDEIVKAVVGSSGALADREEVKKGLERSSSPAQLNELIANYKKLALGQLHGLQKQYETATGLKNFGELLLPGTLKQLGGLKEGGKAGETKPKGSVNIGGKAVGWSIVE